MGEREIVLKEDRHFSAPADRYSSAISQTSIPLERTETFELNRVRSELASITQIDASTGDIPFPAIEIPPTEEAVTRIGKLHKVKENIHKRIVIASTTTHNFFSHMSPEKSVTKVIRAQVGVHARLAFLFFAPLPDVFFVTGLLRTAVGLAILLSIDSEFGKRCVQGMNQQRKIWPIALKARGEMIGEWTRQRKQGSELSAGAHWRKVKREVGEKYQGELEDMIYNIQYHSLTTLQRKHFEDMHEEVPELAAHQHFKKMCKEQMQLRLLQNMASEIESNPQDAEKKKALILRIRDTFPTADTEDIYGLFFYALDREDSEEDVYKLFQRFPQATVQQLSEVLIGSTIKEKSRKKLWNAYDSSSQGVEHDKEVFDAVCAKIKNISVHETVKSTLKPIGKSAVGYRAWVIILVGIMALAIGPVFSAGVRNFLAASSYRDISQLSKRYKVALKKSREAFEKQSHAQA